MTLPLLSFFFHLSPFFLYLFIPYIILLQLVSNFKFLSFYISSFYIVHLYTSNTSLLLLQHKHVTKSTRKDNKRVLRPQRHTIWVLKHLDIVNSQVQTLIYNAGFDHLLKISDFDINHHLITTLVERWRIEAHTFHFPLRECK